MKIYRVIYYCDLGYWKTAPERYSSYGRAFSVATGKSCAGNPAEVREEEIPDPPTNILVKLYDS